MKIYGLASIRAAEGLVKSAYRRFLSPAVHKLFFRELIGKTQNFGTVTWLGHAIWQNVKRTSLSS